MARLPPDAPTRCGLWMGISSSQPTAAAQREFPRSSRANRTDGFVRWSQCDRLVLYTATNPNLSCFPRGLTTYRFILRSACFRIPASPSHIIVILSRTVPEFRGAMSNDRQFVDASSEHRFRLSSFSRSVAKWFLDRSCPTPVPSGWRDAPAFKGKRGTSPQLWMRRSCHARWVNGMVGPRPVDLRCDLRCSFAAR